MTTETWIEEWVFRGRPPSGPDSEKSPRYHVVLGQQGPDPFDPAKLVRRLSDPLLAGDLAALGYSASSLIAQFNADALDRLGELEGLLAARDAEIAELRHARAERDARLTALEATE